MDKLKKFIDLHRDDFDLPLQQGHLNRFETKLNRWRRPLLRRYLFPAVATLAAACLLTFLLVPRSAPEKRIVFVCEVDEEMDALRKYYNMRVYDVEERINSLYETKPSQSLQKLAEEAGKVVRTVREFEEEIFPTLSCTDNGIFAMKLQYDGSLESLIFMLEQMELLSDME
ncbi:MAG: hypothetical protein LBH04_08980 [Tannerellaceae bacterium]|jgi:hypothetical protein|nr:hypothetical protein [Tannerellaceae bacterium]